MDGVVVQFPGLTYAHMEPEKVLEEAKKADLRECLVIGYDNVDGEMYFAGTFSENPEILFMLEMAKQLVFQASFQWSLK